jgi:SAM-dependent methyltransferase
MESAAEIKRRVREQFGSVGDAYVRSAGHAAGDDLAHLVEVARAEPVGRALDVATGGGHTALAVAAFADFVVASDLTEKMLGEAARFVASRQARNVAAVGADAEALAFRDGAFDLVTCRIAPHHFADCAAFVREVARVLRPGGRAIVIDSVSPDEQAIDELLDNVERWRDPTHVRSYTRAQWAGFFEAAGLGVELTAVHQKTHELDDWLARSRTSPEQMKRVRDALRSAAADARERLAIAYAEGGEPVSFADEKLLIVGRRG